MAAKTSAILSVGDQGYVLLDSCCLLSLYASRHLEDVMRVLPMRFAAADKVLGESLFVYRGGAGPDAYEREPIDLGSVLRADLLEVLHAASDEEFKAYYELGLDLGVGEALTGALAIHRNAAVATDDRKARRILRAHAPHMTVLGTATLLKAWLDCRPLPAAAVQQILTDVEKRGRFVPPAGDPLHSWWRRAVPRRA